MFAKELLTRWKEAGYPAIVGQTPCTVPCTIDFSNPFCFMFFMKADSRISIKDHRRNKKLTISLTRTPFTTRQFFVRMNGARWPASGAPVSQTGLLAALRKALVNGFQATWV